MNHGLALPTRRKPFEAFTTKQLRFIEEYLLDHNATQAAIRAGYRGKYIERLAHKLVEKSRDVLKIRLQDQRKELRGKVSITRERWLKELIYCAFYDPGKMFDLHGNPIEIPKLPHDVARAIAGFECWEEFTGRGESCKVVGRKKKVKLVDKLTALKLFGEAMGYFDTVPRPGENSSSLNIVFVSPDGKRSMPAQPPSVVAPNPAVKFVTGR